MSEPSDGSLLWSYRQGDAAAGTQLIGRYAARLQGLARANFSFQLAGKVEAEDIVQSVFRRFFEAVDRGNYEVPRGADLWSLLMVIALNRIRGEEKFLRSERRDVRRTVRLGAEAGASVDAADRQSSQALLELVLRDALQRLPEHHQRVVQLRIENYEVAEIARITNRSKRTTERILQDARTQLQALLSEGHGS